MNTQSRSVKKQSPQLCLATVCKLFASKVLADRIRAARMLRGNLPGFEAVILRRQASIETNLDAQWELIAAGSRIAGAVNLQPDRIMELICDATAILIGKDPAYETEPCEVPVFDMTIDPLNDFALSGVSYAGLLPSP